MATTIPSAVHARNLGDYQRRVRSPLDRLRGYIYFYVGLEAALLLLLLAAACFWLSLTFDYGLFKASGLDWVQQGAWAWVMRLVLLILAVGGVLAIVTLTVLRRLLREFSDPALALVLERRFPGLLGDRLITAVELSDLRRAAEQGYSPAMVLETIHEAAERVQQVPVIKVFDWRRLLWRSVLVLGMTLGLYVLAGGLFLTLDLCYGASGRTGYSRFNEVIQMWSERNIFLRHTLWPRRVQLVFVNVPEGGLCAGVGGPAPQVHVRALEYVLADDDPKSRDGWKALTWGDLVRQPELVDKDTTSIYVPSIRLKGQQEWNNVTVDDVALKLGRLDGKAGKPGSGTGGWEVAIESTGHADKPPEGRPLIWGDLDAVQDVLTHVNARVKQPDMSRTMRRLDVPDSVYLSSAGCKKPPQSELKRDDNNEYTYEFKDLQFESNDHRVVTFSMAAEDYTTPTGSLTIVDPPDLVGVQLQQSQPAYLFYPPRATDKPEDAVTLAFLHGKKQPIQVQTILTSGNDAAHIDVPAGTDLVLTAAANKDLKEAFLNLTPNKADVTTLRLRIDPSKVRAGASSSEFLVGPDPKDAKQWVRQPLSVKPVPGDPSTVVLQTTREDEKVKDKPATGEPLRLPLEILENKDAKGDPHKRVFHVELPEVRRSMAFTLEYTDSEGVTGRKRVDIQAPTDAAPVIQDVSIVGLRTETKTLPGGEKKVAYVVTPRARVPVSARIADDHCLGEVLYHFSVRPVSPAPPTDGPKPAAPPPEPPARQFSYSPQAFLDLVGAANDGLPVGTVQKLLQQPQQLPFRQMLLKRDVDVHADTINVGFTQDKHPTWRDAHDPANKLNWDFPLWQSNLALDDEHPLYGMDFWLEAADTDADDQTAPDGAPQPNRSKSSATYTFVVVRDSYLNALIGQDEAKQYKELNSQFQSLAGLTTDYEVFKSEAEAFQKSLKDGGDLGPAADVGDFIIDVAAKVQQTHQIDDPEAFLLSSEPHKRLMEYIQGNTNEDKDLLKTLEADPPPANPDALRRLMRKHEEFQSSVARLDGLACGFREEKSTVRQMMEAIGAANAVVGDLEKQDVQLDRIAKALDGAIETTRKGAEAYERLVREEQLNVLDGATIDYTQKRIVNKLHEIQRLDFPAATEAVSKFHKSLTETMQGQTAQERIDRARNVGKDLQEPMTRLVADLNDVLEAIRRGESRQSLKQKLTDIDKGVQDEAKYAKDVQKYLEDQIFKQ